MAKRTLMLGVVLGFVLAGSAWAILPVGEHAYEVPVSLEMAAPTYQQLGAAEASRALPGWDAFTGAQGQGWIVAQYLPALGTPSTLMGPGIPVAAANADDAAIRDAADRFVADHGSLLKCDPQQLGRPEIIALGEKRQVLYGQTYQGLEVVGGRVELYLSNGQIIMMGSQYYPGISIGTAPGLSSEQASEAALSGMQFNPVTDKFLSAPRLVVYPMILQGSPSYYLAWEVRFTTSNPVGDWWTYVDASDGQVLTRTNNVSDLDIPTTVLSDVEPNWEFEDYTELPGQFQWVTVNGGNYYTDINGFVNLSVPNNQSYTVQSELRGSYTNVNRDDGADAHITTSGTPNTPLTVKFDDTNSQASERDAYYSVNRVHNWLKAVDPGFTSMDFPMNCNVNISGSCNAYWNGSSINFYAAGGGCVNMAQISDVVMHEYGHGISQYTYSPNTPPNSSGMGEGLSDIVAQNLTNERYMARGYLNGNGYMRDGMNLRQYPGTECSGEVHCLGEIIMGAMWKTRLNMTTDLGYGPGKAKYETIMRAAWKTKQYSMPNFLTRLLMADDDNNNLGDGTPDWYNICDGFAVNNLPCPALTQYIQFTHTPILDQTGTTTPYEVVSLIQAINCGTLVADSLRVWYSNDNGQNWANALMTPTGTANQFRGYIPAQACGTIVNYYIRARTSTGVTGTEPNRAPAKGTNKFMVGPLTVQLNDTYETDQGWTVGAPGDAAVDGIWQRVDPVGKVDPYNNEVVQPEDDHTAAPGVNCFVTDGSGGYYLNHDVDGGATTIRSPIYNWSGVNGVGVVSFWGFFANESVIDDTLRCSVSNDGGNTWLDLVKISGMDKNAWNYYKTYFSESQIPFTNQMRFRFQIADFNASLTEGAVDDVLIQYTNCTTDEAPEGTTAPAAFTVEPSQPNPVRSSAVLRFALPAAGPVSVELFDAAGRMVRNLSPGSLAAGVHSVQWDGRDDAGHTAASGMYYYRVRANGQEVTRKLMVVR